MIYITFNLVIYKSNVLTDLNVCFCLNLNSFYDKLYTLYFMQLNFVTTQLLYVVCMVWDTQFLCFMLILNLHIEICFMFFCFFFDSIKFLFYKVFLLVKPNFSLFFLKFDHKNFNKFKLNDCFHFYYISSHGIYHVKYVNWNSTSILNVNFKNLLPTNKCQ